MEIREILEKCSRGELSPAQAEELLSPTLDMGFARLDLARQERCGYPEVVFCRGKEDEHLLSIFKALYEKNGRVLGTRALPGQYELIKDSLPRAEYDPVSGIIRIGDEPVSFRGMAVICSAGTADIPVAREAALTARFLGCRVSELYDVGVSGLHRLLEKVELLRSADCVIAVAGMEGALASVIGGLVSRPVIAVPTSVGYGASFGGLSALLTMLNSCSNGVAVVNIDNGYGAGYLAAQIGALKEADV